MSLIHAVDLYPFFKISNAIIMKSVVIKSVDQLAKIYNKTIDLNILRSCHVTVCPCQILVVFIDRENDQFLQKGSDDKNISKLA